MKITVKDLIDQLKQFPLDMEVRGDCLLCNQSRKLRDFKVEPFCKIRENHYTLSQFERERFVESVQNIEFRFVVVRIDVSDLTLKRMS